MILSSLLGRPTQIGVQDDSLLVPSSLLGLALTITVGFVATGAPPVVGCLSVAPADAPFLSGGSFVLESLLD